MPSHNHTSRRKLVLDCAVGLLSLGVLVLASLPTLGLPLEHAVVAALGYACMSGILWVLAPARLPDPGTGWANRVTLFRATLVLPVAALLVTPGHVGGSTAWTAVVVATLALALDGVDGAVARRTGTATPFGARFDMELDSFLILALALLVWVSTPLGAWVVWIGLIRYAFLLAGWVWRPLRGDLFDSFRRKAVCVIQVAGLLIALAPITPVSVDRIVCAAALLLLIYSFAVDIVWLVRRPRSGIVVHSGP